MDFESPDVEKEFPGLYASESGRKSNESDFSDGGDHEKPSKKDLLGRRKEKKEKKDRGYAALEGESSPEEDTDTKSPSKSKKTKSFKFPTKSKEKREKSRDKEKVLEEVTKHKELTEKEKKKKEREEKEKREKLKEKEKRDKLKEKDKEKEEKAKFKLESKEKLKDDKKDKTKDKDKEKVKEKDKEKVKEKEKDKVKEKDKEKVKEKEKEKVKDKDKDKKDKKLIKVPSTVTSGIPFEDIFTLGVALPIFGVPLQQSVERSRCHDDTCLPLVVRDSIDYLQAYGIKSNQIYRQDADKIKLQQLRKLYTDRGDTFPYHWDVPVACAILKSFLSELPESILTQELHAPFEQTTAMAEPARELAVRALLGRLPDCHHNLLGWLVRHFQTVLDNEQINHVNAQTISSVMCPALNMTQNLLIYLINKADKLFPDVQLTKYIPPLQSAPAEWLCPPSSLSLELRKQESLLSQIHSEMHAGFSTPAGEQQLWEAQRIVTQLKRKLRSLQKSVEPNALPSQQASIDEKSEDQPPRRNSQSNEQTTVQTTTVQTATIQTTTVQIEQEPKKQTPPQYDAFQPENKPDTSPNLQMQDSFAAEFEDNFDFAAKEKDSFDFAPKEKDNFAVKEKENVDFVAKQKDSFDFPVTEKDEFEFPTLSKEAEFDFEAIDKVKVATDVTDAVPLEPAREKPKLTEVELKKLRLELENAEYLQLKSLLQAKINSEQFEIVKLRGQVALKNKQEGIVKETSVKEIKDYTAEEQEIRQKLMRENSLLEQKRLTLINQIFQERVACTQLKIDLALKELL